MRCPTAPKPRANWAADHSHLLGGATPVLALYMYEHAYLLDFGAKATAYVDAFMQNIRWDNVYRRYGGAIAADALALAAELSSAGVNLPQVIDLRRAEN